MTKMTGGSTLRGGQTVFHGLHMWGQVLRASLLVAAVALLAAPAWRVWRHTTDLERYATLTVAVAELKLALGYAPAAAQMVRLESGEAVSLTLAQIVASPEALAMRQNLVDELQGGFRTGIWMAVGANALLLTVFWFQGRQMGRGRRIRGAEAASPKTLERRVRPLTRRLVDVFRPVTAVPPYRIAGVPYPERAETRHTIVSGTTGSGKTVLISDLVSQIRARGERCVVYDKMGSYTRAFFDPDRDMLLNPLDARSPRWSPFFEARSPRDFDTMAAALIPQQKDTVDPFWVTAARQLFANGAGVLRSRGVSENHVLVDHLLKTDLSKLAKAMEGTVAQSIVDPENPKTALSVRAMLTANIGALELLPDAGPPFSIREWIADEERGGFLFLTSRGDQHASLRGLISTWLEIAVNAMLSLEQDDARRIWVVLDELPTLHQVPSLQPGLAESRQFGGCFVLGIQVISSLRDLYGRNGAETISGLCGTRVVLASPDRDTAQWSADSLGRGEVEEMVEGFSYGASTIRDGISLTPKRELRPLALASEIMQLENLHGWLRFPGPLPVAPIRLRFTERPKVAERFVPRLAPERPATPPEPAEGNESDRAKEAKEAEAGESEKSEPVPEPGADMPPAPPMDWYDDSPEPMFELYGPESARPATPRKGQKTKSRAKGQTAGKPAAAGKGNAGGKRRKTRTDAGATKANGKNARTGSRKPGEPSTTAKDWREEQPATEQDQSTGQPAGDWL